MDVCTLLISPDPDLIAASRRALAIVGIGVEACSNSSAALKLLRSRKYDGIVVDADGVDAGPNLIKTVRAERAAKTAIVFAVIDGNTTMSKAFNLGATFVLEKPLSLDRTTRCFRAAYGLMIGERRRYFRHSVEIPAYLDVDGGASNATATISDLSSGGMKISSQTPLKTERELMVRFTLPGSSDNIQASAMVVWANEDRAGLRFLKIARNGRNTLDGFLGELLDSRPLPARGSRNISDLA